MYSEDTLLRLIEGIYDAALAPERWPAFLEALADVIDGHAVNLALTNTTRAQTTLTSVARLDPEANRLYHEYFWALDPWRKAAIEGNLFHTGVIGLGSEMVPASVYERTEFCNDFGRAYGIAGGISAVIRADASVLALVNASQRPHGRPFDESDVGLLRSLLPHLHRALQVHERLIDATKARGATADVIDRLAFGVVLLDAAGRVVLVNRAAQQVFDAADGLVLGRKGVSASSVQQTAQLREAITRTLAVSRGEDFEISAGSVLSIHRSSPRRPLQVLIAPIRSGASEFTLNPTAPMAALFVSDPENEPVTPDGMLRTLYALTPAEARFAVHLLQHRTVEEAADLLEISLNTARSHLKKLFDKTGTRRQSDLVRLLGGGLGQLRR